MSTLPNLPVLPVGPPNRAVPSVRSVQQWPPRTRALTGVERAELGVALHERQRHLEVAGLAGTAKVLNGLVLDLDNFRVSVEP